MSVNARVEAATRRMGAGGASVVYKVALVDGDQFFTDDPDIDSAFGDDVTGVMVMKLSGGVFITGEQS